MGMTLYGYPQCDTSRSALKWLKARGADVETVNLFETPPSAAEIGKLVEQSGLDVNRFFNVSGEAYREMKLKDRIKGMTLEEKLDLLASNGRLIKRPIATDGSRATVGFREDVYGEVWGK